MEDKTTKQTPIYVAAILKDENSAVEITKILFKFGKWLELEKSTPSHNLTSIGARVNHTDNYSQTALFYIARDGKLDLFNLFVEQGINVNHTDGYS